MNRTQSCLTEETFEQIGRNDVSPQELSTIEQHLSGCERCREMFDAVYATPQWRDEIQPALRDSPAGAPQVDDEYTDQVAVLKLLGPTDNPHMLGRIGNYDVVGLIGRGGMGVVFKAFDSSLDRFVAIKMLTPHLAASGAARKRFLREGKAAAAVVDDHVLPVYGVDQWQGIPYLVMQYSRGTSLQQRLNDQGPLELTEILRISLHVARGLAAAHAQGLVHRDVKPSNILVSDSVERAVLMDFGLARAVDDATMTRSGVVAGTPQYMSPEQARAESIDQRSDLFSLGSVMYAMCTGRAPFRADTSLGVLRLISDHPARAIQEINPSIPAWLCRLISTLMSKQPEQRMKSAQAAAEVLEQCLAHVQQPKSTPLPKSLDGPPAPANDRFQQPPRNWNYWRVLAAAAGGFALLLAGVLILLEYNKGTIRIDSDADDIPIRIMQGEQVVRRLTVTREGKSIRVAAGDYVVVISHPIDGMVVKDNVIALRRGETEAVTITHVPKPQPASDAAPRPPSLAANAAKSLSPELAPVRVSVVGEGGKPLRGAKVKLRMMHSNNRPVEVEGVCQANEVAIDQVLPYGKYWIEVTTPSGWYLSRNLEQVVQFGKGLSLTVVAPSPGPDCTTSLAPQPIATHESIWDLRFGGLQEHSNRSAGYFSSYTPEGDEALGDYASFPSLRSGVSEIALSIQLKLNRDVRQPDGELREWTWSADPKHLPLKFLLSKRGFRQYKTARNRAKQPENETGFFTKYKNSQKKIGYMEFHLEPPRDQPQRLTHPAGRLTVFILDAYGRPNAEVLSALEIPSSEAPSAPTSAPTSEASSGVSEPWLPLNLLPSSTWLSKLLDNDPAWLPLKKTKPTYISHLRRQEMLLEPKQQTTIRIPYPLAPATPPKPKPSRPKETPPTSPGKTPVIRY